MSVATEHTPGPWSWTQDDAGQWFLSPGILIADGSDGTPDGDEHDVANAMLLEAAPDLLEAAKIVLEGLNARIDAAPMGEAPVFAGIAALHDAIAKAEQSA